MNVYVLTKKKDYNAWHEDLFLFNFQNKIKHMVTLSLNSLSLWKLFLLRIDFHKEYT